MKVRSRQFWLGMVGFGLVLTAGKWAIAPIHRSYPSLVTLMRGI
ncbi:MAG: hypothetical protein SFY66_20255 [Oculatellaceae cyanobacterium bins.114]|nr:hypothetical protein [Oculatellaceae cyanobacterium bins.114]